MKTERNILKFGRPSGVGFLLLMVGMAGCATSSGDSAGKTRDLATVVATTAAGGYIGAKEGHGKPEKAALGAAAGLVLGETINYFSNKAQREAYLFGYEKGQSDAVKQQYWIARDNQRAQSSDGYEESYYKIPIPESKADGVLREPTTRVIRVLSPKEEP